MGIFPYWGREIGAPEPNKIYQVFRPAEELDNEDTLNSFKLMPFIDEHEMLGEGETPAEEKGVDGTIGESVYFDHPYIRGNIKVTSSRTIRKIDKKNKIELSPGYRCKYEFESGDFEGQHYDAIRSSFNNSSGW